MSYADALNRVSELDRMLVERTDARRSAPPAGAFARVLDEQLASAGQVPTPAPMPAPIAAAPVAPGYPGGAAYAPAAGYPAAMPGYAPQYAPMIGGMMGVAAPGAPFGAMQAGPSMLRGDLAGLDPQLAGALEQVARQIGKPLEVVSGLRTHAEQKELYQRFLNGTGNLAAVPGTSRHESGRAADVYVDGVALQNVPGANQAARAVGLGFPVSGEPWHVERVGA